MASEIARNVTEAEEFVARLLDEVFEDKKIGKRFEDLLIDFALDDGSMSQLREFLLSRSEAYREADARERGDDGDCGCVICVRVREAICVNKE